MAAEELLSVRRINQLDNRLANQIAAGEVVERPASVVKELMENAIDAGATRIEVDIERGGTRLIRVTDNGCGIVKEDLALALCRHATSKINSIEDLAAIDSLGFRGEALASIASVSRLTLTSRTQASDFAWQAIAEGRDMAIEIQPASATVGTRIEVRDLFYNTPARQKFLRAEKTEFAHIEEIFKRHALSNAERAFILKHNGRIVKRIPAGGKEPAKYLNRIEAICGKPFAQNAIPFECVHEIVQIHGWVGGPHFHRSESDLQYVFVNGRPVKDKTLNHAIKQAYQGLIPPGRMATFVIFLEMDPLKIDVNVHPTKHEVRFEEQRTVHDLLVKSISETINQVEFQQTFDHIPDSASRIEIEPEELKNTYAPSTSYPSYERASSLSYRRASGYSSLSESRSVYSSASEKLESLTDYQNEENELTHSLLKLGDGYWVTFCEQKAFVIEEVAWLITCISYLIQSNEATQSKSLLFPQLVELDTQLLEELKLLNLVQNLGFVLSPNAENSILLQKVPLWMALVDTAELVNWFPGFVSELAKADTLLDELSSLVMKEVYRLPRFSSADLINYFLSKQPELLEKCGGVKRITSDIAKGLLHADK